MDRLTKRIEAKGLGVVLPMGCGTKKEVSYYEIMSKLAAYEDLEEQERLIKLPCKVGDKAYFIHRGEIKEDVVEIIMSEIYEDEIRYWLKPQNADISFKLGAYAFIIREEAEVKLKGIKED